LKQEIDMANKAAENFDDWLRDAHAMEEQAEQMLRTTASRIENYPEVKARLESHCEVSRRQAARLRTCLERRGESSSAVKNLAGKITAFGQGISGLFVSDEIVKAVMATYTFAHFEISSYRSLIAAAEALGDAETQRVCKENLAEEEAMAEWLAQQLPSTTTQFLARADTPGVKAKH
jgi:ferritin-like metal-binding protein YciE